STVFLRARTRRRRDTRAARRDPRNSVSPARRVGSLPTSIVDAQTRGQRHGRVSRATDRLLFLGRDSRAGRGQSAGAARRSVSDVQRRVLPSRLETRHFARLRTAGLFGARRGHLRSTEGVRSGSLEDGRSDRPSPAARAAADPPWPRAAHSKADFGRQTVAPAQRRSFWCETVESWLRAERRGAGSARRWLFRCNRSDDRVDGFGLVFRRRGGSAADEGLGDAAGGAGTWGRASGGSVGRGGWPPGASV